MLRICLWVVPLDKASLTTTLLTNFTVSNEMQVHQLPFKWDAVKTCDTSCYHTEISNHMNSKANLITLPLIQVETHTTWLSQLEQEVHEYILLDYPQTILKKGINLWFKVPKIYFRNTLMCVRSTLCNVQLPVEWKFLGKRFGFLAFPL